MIRRLVLQRLFTDLDFVAFRRMALLLLLASCTTSNPWTLDTISSGDRVFDAARLLYTDPQGSPLRLEFLNTESGIISFLSLAQYKFHGKAPLSVKFFIDKETLETFLSPLEGGMRLKLPEDLTLQLIKALQEGKSIVILVDDFEQTLTPGNFPTLYENLTSNTLFPANLLKRAF
ncbi:MAG: hypothetical protein HY861_02640 [Chlamydiia bacterium]|nr:hypothetical protein [Chlamydiia bacterium]